MVTVVLLAFADSSKEFIDDTHIHGLRDGQLLIATGAPGAGLGAQIVRTVPLVDLTLAETTERGDEPDGDSDGSEWSMAWPDG